ncbi:AI-2E family transporter [Brachybacterium sp. JHP9]|uniref:AI-2E family transporter n=1 Tax=Brachybacterium equifaecis TaxID=2910770 RepID=A0ABT0QZX3_9MICO|nr:AI-2E family transporter [Brachybacterium equifaecis]MCL6422738.1 AI-2E family transporter [Brachybacterium equifaecis]
MLKPRNLRAASAARAASAPQEVQEIPIGVRRLGAWSWRFLIIAAAFALIIWGLVKLATLVVPVLIAVLIASFMMPLVNLLTKHTFLGRLAASALALVGLIVVVVGMAYLAGRQLVDQASDISVKAVSGFQGMLDWATQTFNIEKSGWLDTVTSEALAKIQENSGRLISGAFSTVSVVGTIGTGIIVALFTLLFLLANGQSIWRWCVGLLPPEARVPVHESFRRGWKALSAYMRTQILVAAVDATGIALGMVVLGTGAYAVPIWMLVFLFSFVPLVGAVVSGAIAVLIVFVLKGWAFALGMLAAVLIVQQLESNILQPVLMGKAVELHPLAVFLGVTAGALTAGIAGALFAIPLIAFVNATLLYLTGRDPSPELGEDQAAHEELLAPPQPKYTKEQEEALARKDGRATGSTSVAQLMKRTVSRRSDQVR